MHAGTMLLEALIAASDWIDAQLGKRRTELQGQVQQAIAEATGTASREPRTPIVIEVRGGIVQGVKNVPPSYE
jgi:hypothetical protein